MVVRVTVTPADWSLAILWSPSIHPVAVAINRGMILALGHAKARRFAARVYDTAIKVFPLDGRCIQFQSPVPLTISGDDELVFRRLARFDPAKHAKGIESDSFAFAVEV